LLATSAGYRGGTLDAYYGGKKLTPRPDAGITKRLIEASKEERVKRYTGPVFSSDAFYAEDPDSVTRLARNGYVAVEMECATLFGLGKLRRVRTAGIFLVSDNLAKAQPLADAKVLSKYVDRTGRMVLESLSRVRNES